MNRLRQLRKERGISLQTLSNDIGMSVSNIATIERDEIKISYENAKIFASYFDCSIEYLLCESEDRKKPDVQILATLKGEKLEIINKINDLSDDQIHDLNLMFDILYKKK